MKIHREMAVYRLLILRAQEAFQRKLDALGEAKSNGEGIVDGWEVETETRIHLALDGLVRKQCNDICEAFEDRESEVGNVARSTSPT
jgi:hypothetical protein